jgi:hypothetical protein
MNMKTISNIYFSLLLIAACSLSCNKSNFNYPAGTVGISKIIYFPSVTIIGNRIVTTTQGADFTDSGATAILNGKPVAYTTDPTISSTTAPGVYTVTYTAANAQGFSASDWRYVVVVPTSALSDPLVPTNDFSGTYLRAATGVTSTWTKISTGVYQVENPGGASVGVGMISVVVNFSGTTISMPSQDDPDFGGTISATNATYVPSPPPASYSWVFNASGYGTSVRTFVEQ